MTGYKLATTKQSFLFVIVHISSCNLQRSHRFTILHIYMCILCAFSSYPAIGWPALFSARLTPTSSMEGEGLFSPPWFSQNDVKQGEKFMKKSSTLDETLVCLLIVLIMSSIWPLINFSASLTIFSHYCCKKPKINPELIS